MHTANELAIVIPATNAEHLLPTLLISLALQDYQALSNTKVCVADGNSTDRTREVALSFAPWLDIEVIPSGRAAIGCNDGARRASSRYVLFTDADLCIFDHTLIRRMLEICKRKQLYCATTGIRIGGAGIVENLLYSGDALLQRFARHRPSGTSIFLLFERETFLALGGFDEQGFDEQQSRIIQRIARRKFAVIPGRVFTMSSGFAKLRLSRPARPFAGATPASSDPSLPDHTPLTVGGAKLTSGEVSHL